MPVINCHGQFDGLLGAFLLDLFLVVEFVARQALRFLVQSEQVSICFVDGNRFDFQFGVFQIVGSEDDTRSFAEFDFIKTLIIFLRLFRRSSRSVYVDFRIGNICLNQTWGTSKAFNNHKLGYASFPLGTH